MALSKMAPKGKTANTMFGDVPSVVWELKSDGREMVREHVKLMKWIDRLLYKTTKEPFEYFDGEKWHRRPKTADGGFFKVIMRTSEEYLRPGQEKDLVLLFSLYDLYLIGFLHEDIWYVFHDARLDGSGHLSEEHENHLVKLDFDGSHTAKIFNTKIGYHSLAKAHNTLCNHLNRKAGEVRVALMMIAVVISEAKRFYEFLQLLLETFGRSRSEIFGVVFLTLFQHWSKTCKELLGDPQEYEPQMPQHPTYISAVKAISVVRVSEEETVEPIVDAEDKYPVQQILDDYDSKPVLEAEDCEEMLPPVYHHEEMSRSELLQRRKWRRRYL